jgi:hypothetical protein
MSAKTPQDLTPSPFPKGKGSPPPALGEGIGERLE